MTFHIHQPNLKVTYAVTFIIFNSNPCTTSTFVLFTFCFNYSVALALYPKVTITNRLGQQLVAIYTQRTKGGSNHEQDINKSNLADRRRFVTVTIKPASKIDRRASKRRWQFRRSSFFRGARMRIA